MSENVKEVRSCTRIRVEACNFTWFIKNFSLCPLIGDEFLISSNFTTGKSLHPAWYLTLYPKRSKPSVSQEGFIGIFLNRRQTVDLSTHFVEWKISIIGSDEAKYHTHEHKGVYDNKNARRGYLNFVERSAIEKEPLLFLANDTLTLMCELKVTVDVKTSEGVEELLTDSSPRLVSKNPDTLIGSLQHVYESEMCSDLNLKVGDEELKVHKLILCARSSVFNTMLNSDMKENLTNCIEISDFDSDVVKTMLQYIYCEQVEDLTPELGIQLYSIADKYNLQDLKKICVKFLLRNLNVHNICGVLVLGEMHNDQKLMAAAKRMFCANAAAIQETEKWLDLSKTMPDLAIAMYRLFISQKET